MDAIGFLITHLLRIEFLGANPSLVRAATKMTYNSRTIVASPSTNTVASLRHAIGR